MQHMTKKHPHYTEAHLKSVRRKIVDNARSYESQYGGFIKEQVIAETGDRGTAYVLASMIKVSGITFQHFSVILFEEYSAQHKTYYDGGSLKEASEAYSGAVYDSWSCDQ